MDYIFLLCSWIWDTLNHMHETSIYGISINFSITHSSNHITACSTWLWFKLLAVLFWIVIFFFFFEIAIWLWKKKVFLLKCHDYRDKMSGVFDCKIRFFDVICQSNALNWECSNVIICVQCSHNCDKWCVMSMLGPIFIKLQ